MLYFFTKNVNFIFSMTVLYGTSEKLNNKNNTYVPLPILAKIKYLQRLN